MKKNLLNLILSLAIAISFIPGLTSAQFDLTGREGINAQLGYLDGQVNDRVTRGLAPEISSIEQYHAFQSQLIDNLESTTNSFIDQSGFGSFDNWVLGNRFDGIRKQEDAYYQSLLDIARNCPTDASAQCQEKYVNAINQHRRLGVMEKDLQQSITSQLSRVDTSSLSPQAKEAYDNLVKQTPNLGRITVQNVNNRPAEDRYISDHDQTSKDCKISISGVTWGNCFAAAFDWIFAIINAIIGIVLRFTGWLFNQAIEFSVIKFRATASSPGIMEIWKMIRDLTNIGFIFMLLYAGFMTLFQDLGGKMNPREIVAKVLLFALLVNFSAPLTRTAIDLSNVPALLFYNQMAAGQVGENPNISNFIIQNSNVAVLSNWHYTVDDNAYGTNSANVESPALRAISKGLLTMLVFIGLIYVLATATFNFLLRSFILLFLIMTSPVYFIAKVVPGSAVEGWAKRWMKNLKCWCLYAPIYMGGLYLVMALMANRGNINLSGTSGTSSIFIEVVWFGLILTLLFSIDKLAKDLGCEMASAGGKFETKLRGYGSSILSKGKALPGRTLGRAYTKGASKLTGKIADRASNWASAEGTGVRATTKRWIGWGVAPALSKLPDSKFGTSASYKERGIERGNRHKAVMARMNNEQKARYIESLTAESAKDAYNSLSKKEKIDVALVAQRIAISNGVKFEDTKIGKARKDLKGEAKDELKEQAQKQLYNEAKNYANQKEKTRDVLDENSQPVMEDVTDRNGVVQHDENGQPLRRRKTEVVQDEDGKPVMETVTDDKERFERMAEFIARQNKEDQQAIFEKMGDIDRGRLKFYGESIVAELVRNDQGTQRKIAEEVQAELDQYRRENTTASAAQISEKEQQLRLEAEVKARAKALDFAALDNSLDSDKREKSNKEYKRLDRQSSKKELDELVGAIGDDITAITENQKRAVTELLNKFKGNYQELGNLLTNQALLGQIDLSVISDLRSSNQNGPVNNILDTVDRQVNRYLDQNPEMAGNIDQIAAQTGINPDLVAKSLNPNQRTRSQANNDNTSRTQSRRRGKKDRGDRESRRDQTSSQDSEAESGSQPTATTEPAPEPQKNNAGQETNSQPANTSSASKTPATENPVATNPPAQPVVERARPQGTTPQHREPTPPQPPVKRNAAREANLQNEIIRYGNEGDRPNNL